MVKELLILLLLLSNNLVFALAADVSTAQLQDAVSLEDKIISYAFKGIARAFVSVVDIDKLKKSNIEKLNNMKEEKFKKQYALAYKVIKECDFLASNYGMREDMAKLETIRKIESLDKKEIYGIIEAIPDTVIATQFKNYLSGRKQDLEKYNIFEQINKVWGKIIQKAQ